MSGRPLPSSGRAAEEIQLLAQLGLPSSASPEDVDQAHLAVSRYLAAAPSGLKGWAHAQATALDQAYLNLTDPVGLQSSALRSSTRPPTVVPGGPATPPARRGPVPAVAVIAATEVQAVEADSDVDTDDLGALYASVTPSVHPDMLPGAVAVRPTMPAATAAGAGPGSRKNVHRATVRAAAAPVAVPPASGGPWKWIAIATTGVLAVVLVFGFLVPFVFNIGGVANGGTGGTTAQASPSGTTVDMQVVAQLMTKLQANSKDTATLQALGDAYYKGGDYAQAGQFYDQLLAIDPKNVTGLLARGAVYFNTSDLANAAKSWKLVVSIDPKNQEAHYDLGFLYMNQASPDWTNVQVEWNKVIAIDPTTQLATTVQSHLTSLAAASLIPAASGSAGASAGPSGSATPSGSAGASPAPSGSAAPLPSASTKP